MPTHKMTTLSVIHHDLRKISPNLETHHVRYALETLFKAGKITRQIISGVYIYEEEANHQAKFFLIEQGHLPRSCA